MATCNRSEGPLRKGGGGQEEGPVPCSPSHHSLLSRNGPDPQQVSLCPRNPPEFLPGRSDPQLNQAGAEDSLDSRSGHREEEEAGETPVAKRFTAKLGAEPVPPARD